MSQGITPRKAKIDDDEPYKNGKYIQIEKQSSGKSQKYNEKKQQVDKDG